MVGWLVGEECFNEDEDSLWVGVAEEGDEAEDSGDGESDNLEEKFDIVHIVTYVSVFYLREGSGVLGCPVDVGGGFGEVGVFDDDIPHDHGLPFISHTFEVG